MLKPFKTFAPRGKGYQMYPSYKKINVKTLSVTYETWLSTLKMKLPVRSDYKVEDNHFYFGRVACKFLGLPIDKDEYYNHLFEYVHDESLNLHLLSEESLDKSMDNRKFQAIQKVVNLLNEQELSINRFVAFLDGEQLLVKHESPTVHRRIRESMIETLEHFAAKEKDGLKNVEFRRVIVDVLKWSFNHLSDMLVKLDLKQEQPKFLWYGDFKKSHQYFLCFIMKFGCDLVIFHPGGKDPLDGFLEENLFTYHYDSTGEVEPFPKEKRTRVTTVAYRASREIETILNQEGSGLYKPWQLRDYSPSSLTLKTTYDELFILAKEIAMIRPDFEVKEGKVNIPSLFAKIQGVSKNRKEYWDRLHSMTSLEHSLVIRHFPFSIQTSNDFRFHYRDALDRNGGLDVEKMMQANYWKYSHLPSGLQKGIGNAIRSLCENPPFKRNSSESIDELRTYIFSQSMQISNSLLKLMQQFDYSQEVPKLIIFNNGNNGVMIRSDAVMLALLNKFGLDIVIYNPAGHNDIENYIEERCFDTHWLEDIVFDQEYKEPTSSKKGWLQGLIKNIRRD